MQDMAQLERMFAEADEIGFRMELVGGIPTWETSPVWGHQEICFRIEMSLEQNRASGTENGCGCYHAPDVSLRFPDGSLKRPDIAVFCEKPEAVDETITGVPDAVIEIISKGYEKKDWEIGVPFYLKQGMNDIVVFDPFTLQVAHFQDGARKDYTSPIALVSACSCTCTV